MKRIAFLILIGMLLSAFMAVPGTVFSQVSIRTDSGDADSELFTNGLLRNKILIWGGTHYHHFGYIDKRYRAVDDVGNKLDQGNYIKTTSQQYGCEVVIADFSSIAPVLKSGKFGFNLNLYFQDKIGQRSLYAVPGHSIPLETVPGKSDPILEGQKIGHFGFFMGTDKKWYEIDLGLTFALTVINEKTRERIAENSVNSNPTYVEEPGRGWRWKNSKLIPNFLFRLGIENKPYFTISALREDYDPAYGRVQSALVFPIGSYFKLRMGGYLYRNQAAFLGPEFTYAGVSIGSKIGMFLHYKEKELNTVGLQDSLFYSVSVGYGW